MGLNKKWLLLLLTLSTLQASDSWYDQKLEGWYYFEDKEKQDAPAISPETAEAILEAEKLKLKRLLNLALVVPTPENVERYIREQKKWIDQSAHFADAWGKVLLEHPHLGDFLAQPTTTYGILAKRDLDLQNRKALLEKLSHRYFLVFFFKGKEVFSEKAAEVAHLFASVNQWKIKSVSLDGQGTKNMTDFEIDKGLSEKFSVQATPSLFIVDPVNNKAFPVGAGLLSVSEIEQNIEKQITGEENDE